jgi:hypothetical protein
MIYRNAVLLVGSVLAAATASAQIVPLHIGTTNSVRNEFGQILKGTCAGATFFGYEVVSGEVVHILQANSGIFPPAVDGTPDTNNPVVAQLAVGEGVDPSLGPVGMFGGSLAQRPSGQIFARVFNKPNLSDASFYTDSQLFAVPTTNYDVFVPELERTTSPMDPSDNDNDGLNNSWEKSLASDANNPDTDGDGMADGSEFRAGTDLTNAASLLVMVELRPAGGSDLEVSWDSVAGKQYQIEYTADDLAQNPTYSAVSGVITATSSMSAVLIDDGLLQPAGHYRVLLVE